jgi:hypothetical protein
MKLVKDTPYYSTRASPLKTVPREKSSSSRARIRNKNKASYTERSLSFRGSTRRVYDKQCENICILKNNRRCRFGRGLPRRVASRTLRSPIAARLAAFSKGLTNRSAKNLRRSARRRGGGDAYGPSFRDSTRRAISVDFRLSPGTSCPPRPPSRRPRLCTSTWCPPLCSGSGTSPQGRASCRCWA